VPSVASASPVKGRKLNVRRPGQPSTLGSAAVNQRVGEELANRPGEIEARRQVAAERAREEEAATVERPREVFEAERPERESLEEDRRLLAGTQTVFDLCAAGMSSAEPIGVQRICFDEGRFLYYCWLGPAESYCEREYSSLRYRGCGQNVRLHARVDNTLRELGWKGWSGARFKALR